MLIFCTFIIDAFFGDSLYESHFERKIRLSEDLSLKQVYHNAMNYDSIVKFYCKHYLAHAKLAEVFWGKTMGIAIGMENFFVIFLAWGAFAAITVGVLLLMDVLECFLQ